jgi:DNA-binding response OmpR family regulator
LVVDDDPSIRFLCRVNLELDGWLVREAGTLDDARSELLEGDVSVVLLDVHVGTQSGIDYLDELRRDHPGVSVAMLTGSVGTPTLEGTTPTLEGTTPDAVLAKPFTLEQLAETVRRLASRTAHTPG